MVRRIQVNGNSGNLILLAIEDISERQLVKDELAQANRRKDEFLAMLSHELRNPLAPIINAVQLLQLREANSPIQTKAISIIMRHSRTTKDHYCG